MQMAYLRRCVAPLAGALGGSLLNRGAFFEKSHAQRDVKRVNVEFGLPAWQQTCVFQHGLGPGLQERAHGRSISSGKSWLQLFGPFSAKVVFNMPVESEEKWGEQTAEEEPPGQEEGATDPKVMRIVELASGAIAWSASISRKPFTNKRYPRLNLSSAGFAWPAK